MTVAGTPDNRLEMSVRSNEIRGIDATTAVGDETKNKRITILTVLLGMVGTLLALTGTAIAFYSSRRFRISSADLVLGLGSSSHREDMIAYILALSKILPVEADTYYRDDLTYIRTGDLLLAIGLRDAQLKPKCIAALRALLDCDMISSSADAILDNLRRLGFDTSDAAFEGVRAKATSRRDLMAMRRQAASYFDS
jgi:hypothetical protein